ncbi:hypothetical protein RJ639_038894 [Escallonia herrerae]|uniref:Uncharacterized protein n=1 Tax=Escallonia herrerae TaxID=1293975 RepID=A0AA88WLK3_9ASTE|nr:hypothetical protein RJ639_038894 [Escallonia herrerae]
MVKVGIANATATSTYLSSQVLSKAANDTSVKKLFKECVEREARQPALKRVTALPYLGIKAAGDGDGDAGSHQGRRRSIHPLPDFFYPRAVVTISLPNVSRSTKKEATTFSEP